MILPTEKDELQRCVRWLVDQCLSTRDDRDRLYQYREKCYLFGNNGLEPARVNLLHSHLDLVTSFLYSPDHAFYHVAAENGEDPLAVAKAIALQDDFNEDFQEGVSETVSDVITWSLCYDTMLLKAGWNRDRKHWFVEPVPPHNFGVYREDIKDLDSQKAFTHTYFIDYQEAVGKMFMAGMADEISRIAVTHSSQVSPFPEMLQRMIISGTTGSSLTGTLFGQVNPDFAPASTFQAQTSAPLVRFNEMWVWDDRALDYRMFHMIEPDILVGDSAKTIKSYRQATQNVVQLFGRLDKMGIEISETNPFMPGDHPFVKIQPYGKYNYFWGIAHIEALIRLQAWILQRIDQIDDILDRQADPARVGSGFLGLNEEKMAAFGGAGTFLFDQMPQAKMEEFKPEMPPDIFAEYKEIKGEFLEASGLTEIVAGKSVRGRARQDTDNAKKSGSGRIKKAAITIEGPLVKLGDIGLKLKMAHDDEETSTSPDEEGKVHKFLPAETGRVKMKVDGHSHSPLFGDESRELAIVLRKFGAIDDEDLVRMTNPPARDNLLHAIHRRKQQARKAQRENPEAFAEAAKHARGGKKK